MYMCIYGLSIYRVYIYIYVYVYIHKGFFSFVCVCGFFMCIYMCTPDPSNPRAETMEPSSEAETWARSVGAFPAQFYNIPTRRSSCKAVPAVAFGVGFK